MSEREEIISFLKDHSDGFKETKVSIWNDIVGKKNKEISKLPIISEKDWQELSSKYTKDVIRDALADYFIIYEVEFPFRKIEKKIVKRKFFELLGKGACNFILNVNSLNNEVWERFDYKHNFDLFGLGVIQAGSYFNDISNYYQQVNRFKCGHHRFLAPLTIWNDRELLAKMNWIFWRSGVSGNNGINDEIYRLSFHLGSYVASQFKPHVAKTVYQAFSSKRILDTSCGWGDRLAGFYTTSKAKHYVGCDPNPEVFELYKEQCLTYEGFLGSNPKLYEEDKYFCCEGTKKVEIYNIPSEDFCWNKYQNFFDLAFTSPPYFCTELYGKGTDCEENQSWYKYKTFDEWRDNFFLPVSLNTFESLKNDGYMFINIIDPLIHGKRQYLCDDFIDFMEKQNECYFLGNFGMRMSQMPKRMEKEELTKQLKKIFIEPIWVFRKQNNKYEPVYKINKWLKPKEKEVEDEIDWNV